MKIREINVMLLALAAMFMMWSCKDDDDSSDSSSDSEVVYYNLSLMVNDPCEDNTELTKEWTWKSGDRLAVLNLTNAARNVVRINYDGSKFSGSVPSLASSANMGFFYPESAVVQSTADTSYVRISCVLQDGVNIVNYMAGSCTSTVDGTNAEASLTMSVLNAVANLSLKCNGAPINNITHLEIYATKGSLMSGCDYELKTMEYNNQVKANISVISAGLNGSARVILFPSNGVRLGVTAITSDGHSYVGENKTIFNIVAGGVYDLEFDCDIYDKEAQVGDYFYSDFTHSAEYDDTRTCVGVVFALSDKEGGEINRSLKQSFHGRVVSLSDVGKHAWANTDYSSLDMPLLANFGTVDGANAYGYLPFHVTGGNMGYYEEADIKIDASLNADGSINQWPDAGALNDFDGHRNTESIDSAYNKYPAGYYSAHYNRGGINTWYMPAAGEMALIYAQVRSGIIGSQEGFIKLQEFGYWTSTECTEQKVWVLQSFDGKLYTNFKTSTYCIRPVMAF
ncbi:MAG: hypothetical protein ACI308_09135 [Muribaculaceae bacterium]